MNTIILHYFDDPDNLCVPYAKDWIDDDDDESSFMHNEHGYVALRNRSVYTAEGLFEGLLHVDNDELYCDLVNCFSQHLWADQNYFTLSVWEELDLDWNEFCKKVKDSDSYSYWELPPLDKGNDSENGLDHILVELGYIVGEYGLIKNLPVGTEFYRVRNHMNSEEAADFKGLASPPSTLVKYPNRMSPVGVSMFYASKNLELCLEEAQVDKTKSTDDLMTSFGLFELSKEVRVIDFTEFPEQPDFWSGVNDTSTLAFLYNFADEISRPIDESKKENYKPTQTMTGFFQREFSERFGIKVDGLVYYSAKDKGRKCYVLFLDNDSCPEYLKLIRCKTKPYKDRDSLCY